MEAYIPTTAQGKSAIVDFIAQSGQQFLPILELLVDAREQLEDFARQVGVGAIEGLLELSAIQLAGAPHPGKAAAACRAGHPAVRRYGHQPGVVAMGRSKVRLMRPRLRSVPDAAGKTVEVEPPAYTALKRDGQLAQRMTALSLGCDLSTRKYHKTLEQAANLVGVSKSEVSRALKKGMAKALEELQARQIPGPEILGVYIDGFVVGEIHVLGAIGVKKDGTKMVLGVRAGSSENLTVATELLTDLRDRGLNPKIPRLFVLDGGKALRSAVQGVFGDHVAVQRCRNHKRRNLLDALPKKEHAHARLVLRAAFALQDAGKGMARLREYAAELERGGESSAAASLREGLEELFTINALGLPASLCRCLGTTNLLDAAHSGTRGRLRRVTNWQDADMAVRWVAAAMLETEKHFRKIHGYKQLWMLEANLKQRMLRKQEDASAGAAEKLAKASAAA